MSVPAFIDLQENEQIAELRSYLKSKGAEISEENSADGLITDLAKVIEASDILFKENVAEAEVEAVINSIISLILIVPLENNEGLVTALCEKLGKADHGDRRNAARLRLFNNLFHGIDERSTHRYVVFCSLIKMAGMADLMHLMNPDLDEIKKWVSMWDIGTQKYQHLLKLLYEALEGSKSSEKAVRSQVIIELLSTYTEDNASQARDDAHKCIVTCVGDPNTFIMDHLLALKPVKFLEGELIHDLLTIFVSGKLAKYEEFYAKHKDFIKSIGLSHEDNLHKMRILTLMQMAEVQTEIDFDTIEQEMRLGSEEVESFVIDIVRTKALRAKMDQMQRKVIISSTTHRTFGKQQWQVLKEQLTLWQSSLNQVMGNLDTVSSLRAAGPAAH